jgi:hypothetical protein
MVWPAITAPVFWLALTAAFVAFAAASLLSLRGALAPGSPLVRSIVSLGLCGGLGIGLACACGRESDWLLIAAWLVSFGLIVSPRGERRAGRHDRGKQHIDWESAKQQGPL